MKLRELIEELNLFERERIPTENQISWDSDVYTNFFNEGDCKNTLEDSSCFSYSCLEVCEEVREEIADLNGEEEKKSNSIGRNGC